MMTSMAMPSDRRFPCLEQPVKCYLSSSQDVRLSTCRNGKLVTRSKRSAHEEFLLIPSGQEGEVMLKTTKWDRFLMCQTKPDGSSCISASALPDKGAEEGDGLSLEKQDLMLSNYKWQLVKGEGGTVLIIASTNGLHLSVESDNTVALSEASTTCWSIEYLSGELLFVSFPGTDRRLRCDVFGVLSLSENWKGWEVWRFAEEGGETGSIRIASWMHNRYLCSDETGKVSSVSDPGANEGTVWVIDKAPKGTAGLVLRSVVYDRVLCVKENESEENKPPTLQTLPTQTLSTVKEAAALQLEPAHMQKYTFHCTASKCIGPYPYVTTNKRQADEYKLQMVQGATDTGSVLVTIFSCQHQKYLKASDESSSTVELAEEAEVWRMTAKADGSYVFHHKNQNDTVLSIRDCSNSNESDDCELCTAPEDDTICRWRLDPCMPRAISSSKIRTFAIGTSVAIGTTIAMPFAVAGVVGLMGAEMGILANVVAAGLTGAEALASIGVVGTTAALVFRESADSVKASVDESREDEMAISKKRPFCDWRSW